MAHVFALPVGEGFFGIAFGELEFKKEDGQGTHQREVASGDGVTHQAVIFPLGMIAAVMLFNLNSPIAAHLFQQGLGIGLVGPKAGDQISGFVGVFDDLTLAQGLSLAVNTDHLSGAGQAQRRPIGGQNPKATGFNAAVALVDRLRLRGERRS